MRSVVFVPARMEATRFPGKPLAKIGGKPMIQWVYDRVSKCDATDVFVITDSDEICDTVENFNGAYIKTSSSPKNGTERCLEAVHLLEIEGKEYDVILNVQGDEPLINPEDLNKLINLFENEDVDVATLISPIKYEADYRDKNVVKATTTLFDEGYCDVSSFSRSPIPYMEEFKSGVAFQHIGVYGFTSMAFKEIENMHPTELEQTEKLEQLRWMQNHLIISAIVTNSELIGVDTPEDLKKAEALLG